MQRPAAPIRAKSRRCLHGNCMTVDQVCRSVRHSQGQHDGPPCSTRRPNPDSRIMTKRIDHGILGHHAHADTTHDENGFQQASSWTQEQSTSIGEANVDQTLLLSKLQMLATHRPPTRPPSHPPTCSLYCLLPISTAAHEEEANFSFPTATLITETSRKS